MTDQIQPPPKPGSRILRLRSIREQNLQSENDKLRLELEAERALVTVLRSNPPTVHDRAEEPTLPGLGPTRGKFRTQSQARLSKRRRRASKWVLLALGFLGLAAEGASLLYPQLMGPLQLVRRAIEALQGAP